MQTSVDTSNSTIGTVVLLRAASNNGDSDAFTAAFSRDALVACSVRVLECEYCQDEIESFADKLNSTDSYSGVIFTSKNAVEAFQRSMALLGEQPEAAEQVVAALRQKLIYVVGEATKAALNKWRFTLYGSSSGNAEQLATEIVNANKQAQLSPVESLYLFPCGDLALTTLPAKLQHHGIPLRSYTVYKTTQNPMFTQSFQHIVKENESSMLAVMFFSPSGVMFALDEVSKLKTRNHNLKLCAFGETTKAAMEKYGMTCDAVAASPTPQSACEAVRQSLGNGQLDR